MTTSNKLIPLTIERLANGGDGVGHHDGKVIFVPFSAPGDELEVEITEDKPRFARARIINIKSPSKERVEPRCEVFGRCGGCQWQHLDYAAQAQHKERIFRETLERIGQLKEPTVEPIVPADQAWEYRQRIQLKSDGNGNLGFFAHGSHEVVSFDYCHISNAPLNAAIQEQRAVGHGIELNWDGQEVQIRHGEHRSFEQVHHAQNRQLVACVKDYVAPQSHERLLELYCGNGNFSLGLASHCKHIFAADQNAEAIGRAQRATGQRKLAGLHFVVGSAEWALKKAIRDKERIDTVLLDPPRSGAKEILDLIVMLSAHKLVYVSCDPAALARDLKFLTKKGYKLLRSRPIDMFPQTYHIESVTELIHN